MSIEVDSIAHSAVDGGSIMVKYNGGAEDFFAFYLRLKEFVQAEDKLLTDESNQAEVDLQDLVKSGAMTGEQLFEGLLYYIKSQGPAAVQRVTEFMINSLAAGSNEQD